MITYLANIRISHSGNNCIYIT